jgi:tryptophan-rich sensory protein
MNHELIHNTQDRQPKIISKKIVPRTMKLFPTSTALHENTQNLAIIMMRTIPLQLLLQKRKAKEDIQQIARIKTMAASKKILCTTLLVTSVAAFAPSHTSNQAPRYHHVSCVDPVSRKTIYQMDHDHFSVARYGASIPHPKTNSRLQSATADGDNVTDGKGPSTGAAAKAVPRPLDVKALAKWTIGYAGQVLLIYATLVGVDQVVAKYSLKVPLWSKAVFFYLFQQVTSFFSLLPRKRTEQQKMTQKDWEYNKRNQPSWTPPGWVFGLMWPLFVFGTRAVTSAMVVTSLAESGAKHIFSSAPIMLLMAHLCIGNVWNTINNVEKRLGPSVPALWLLAATKAVTALAFYQVNPLAGKLLALTLTWLTAAAVLETDTWRINPDLAIGKKEKLYPVKDDKWVTKFRWES